VKSAVPVILKLIVSAPESPDTHSPGVAPEAVFEFEARIASLKVQNPSSAAESADEFTTIVAAARPGEAKK
jgi:hypothetical protein